MKRILLLAVIFLSLAVDVSAETASDGNISISIDVPDYVSQNETFLINLSAVNISVYPVASGYVYLQALLLKKYWIFFYSSDYWNRNIQAVFRGGSGGIEWHLPSDADFNTGQTIPIKFRAQRVVHNFSFRVIYWPVGYGHSTSAIIVSDEVTVVPVFDPSVHVAVSNGSAVVFEAIAGKGADYIRFGDESQQYIVNWDTSGMPAGEYHIKAGFGNGYKRETKIVLH